MSSMPLRAPLTCPRRPSTTAGAGRRWVGRAHCDKVLLEASQVVRDSLPPPVPRFEVDSALYRAAVAYDFEDLYLRPIITEGARVLDIGCGKGHLAAAMATFGAEVIGLDTVQTPGEQMEISATKWQMPVWRGLTARFDVQFGYFDGSRVPLATESVDVVAAYGMVEHVDPVIRPQWVGELFRVLKPGGALYVARCPRPAALLGWTARRLGLPHHDILISASQLRSVLRAAGFEMEWLEVTNVLPEFMPAQLQPYVNVAARPVAALDRFAARTPLDLMAHHSRCLARRPAA